MNPLPTPMYHGSPVDNRQNIQRYGLLRSEGEAAKMGGYGGIFLSTKKDDPGDHIDVWVVDVRGLALEPDATTEPEDQEDTWWVTYDEDIPPSRLTLRPAKLYESTQPEYPKAGSVVGDLKVRSNIPNQSSISASLTNYQILPGIREVPMNEFGGPKSVFYAADDLRRSERLAQQIKASGEITPLIIVIDPDGPYILEGAHRYVALYHLNVKSFPAMVVIDHDDK